MRWPGYAAFYYEAYPIDELFRRKIPLKEGKQTGGMGLAEFEALKKSISTEGLINPIIVERGRTDMIAMGFNRVEAMEQLGNSCIKAVVLVQGVTHMLPNHIGIPNRFFEHRMKSLHPGDELWRKSQWALRVLRSCRQEIEEPA